MKQFIGCALSVMLCATYGWAKPYVIGDFEGKHGFSSAMKTSPDNPKSGKLSGLIVNMDKRWVSAQKDIIGLNKGVTSVSFWVRSSNAKGIALRLVDSTGQNFQGRHSIRSDGKWQKIVWSDFTSAQVWGGAKDRIFHFPLKCVDFILEQKGDVYIDDLIAEVTDKKIVPAFQWNSKQIGNVFFSGQTVEIPVDTQADRIIYEATDYWQEKVDSGEIRVTDGEAVITPKIKEKGYYLLKVTAYKDRKLLKEVYTSCAIVDKHHIVDVDKSPFGIMSHFAQGMNTELLPLMKDIGVTSFRDEMYWNTVEKKRGQYTIPDYGTTFMKDAKALGLNPLVEMTFANKLYDKGLTPHSPDGLQGFANYGKAIADTFGKQIKYLEVWNEYNGTWCKGPATKDRAKYHTEMLKYVYKTIKPTRPDIKILGCATVLIPMPYLEGIFKYGGLNYMDAVVLHPYRGKPEGVAKEVAEVKELMKKYHNGKILPIWVTETGSMDKREYDWEVGKKMYEKGRKAISQYLVRQYTLLLTENVEKIYWYLLTDHHEFKTMGLLRDKNELSGMGKYAVAPVLVSYATLISQLDGKQYVKREAFKPYTRVYVHHFKSSAEDVRVCWATLPGQIDVEAKGSLTKIDIMGRKTEIVLKNGKARLNLSEDPIYLKGEVSKITEVDQGWRVIADTGDDYSKTQGANNWYYGYDDGSGFKELDQVQTIWGYQYGGVTKYLKIAGTNSHPDKKGGKILQTVRRWKSPVDGSIRIEGHFSRASRSGDGVRFTIKHNGKALFAKDHQGGKGHLLPIKLPLSIKKGDMIDLVVHPKGSTSYDSCNSDLRIIQVMN